MPLAEKRLTPHRVQFEKELSSREVQQLAYDFDLQVLQCSSPVDSRTWDRLDRDLFQNRPDIELRVFGFYSSVCDMSFVRQLPHVRRFSVDRLMQGTGVEHLATMEQLEWLSVDIFNLENFEFLRGIPNTVTKLSLGPTRSKKRSCTICAVFSLSKLCILKDSNRVLKYSPTCSRLKISRFVPLRPKGPLHRKSTPSLVSGRQTGGN
jgi:hypothetical protein